MLFEVLADGNVIGVTDLEHGDPPMGVAYGLMRAEPAYAEFQPLFVAAHGGPVSAVALSVRIVGGPVLTCAGVGIADYSADLGNEGLEVSVLGISHPDYGDLFPEHVAAYEAQLTDRGA